MRTQFMKQFQIISDDDHICWFQTLRSKIHRCIWSHPSSSYTIVPMIMHIAPYNSPKKRQRTKGQLRRFLDHVLLRTKDMRQNLFDAYV